MIVPTKGVNSKRALITVGGEIVDALEQPMTVSSLWNVIRDKHDQSADTKIGFDWYVLTLDMLFSLGVVDFGKSGLLTRRSR